MTLVEDFIHTLPKEQRQIALQLHELMMSNPEVTSKIRFKIPFYYRKSWICYINPLKKGGVDFVFTRGNELSNEQGILDGEGRKQVRGIVIHSPDELPIDALEEVIQEALILDEEVKYGGKRG